MNIEYSTQLTFFYNVTRICDYECMYMPTKRGLLRQFNM